MQKKSPVAVRPQQARIDAQRRLIKAGRADEAQIRIAALRREFPHYKPLLALAWEAAHETGNTIAACLAAWDWSRASPHSAAAWEALALSARTHFPALALTAMRKKDALDGTLPGEEPAPFTTPFGTLTFEQSTRMDTCRMLMSGERLDEAEEILAGIDHVSARNNLALVTFARGEPQRALALLEENWRAAPNNLFGLDRMIRLRLWTRGMDYAAGLGAPLAATQPQRGDDLRAKLLGLTLLGRFEEAEAAWREARPEYLRETREMDGDCRYLAAYIAWRLGQEDEALARLLAAGGDAACTAMAQSLLLARESGDTPDWSVGELAAWWPLSSINALRDKKASEKEVVEKLERLAPHNDYLGRMAEQGGEGPRLLALMLLKSRAANGDAGATEVLKEVLARPCGPYKVRSDLQSWLVETGLMAAGAVMPIWVNGEVRNIRHHALRIVNTLTDEDLPDEDAKRYARALKYHSQGKPDKAESELEALAATHPHHPRILANLSIMRMNMHRPLAEVEELAKRAFEIDPDYAFARIALAHALIRQGDPKEALETVAPLFEREEIHIMEWRACLSVQRLAAESMGDDAAVKRLTGMLARCDTMFDGDD